jgi:RHS repeat-associated protein
MHNSGINISSPSTPLSFINGTLATFNANMASLISRDLSCVGYSGLNTTEVSMAPAYNLNNLTENSRYFYHSDHLGSASFITDRSGRANQHIQYLPFGELFVSQRNSTFDSRYKFTAKELDNETNYTYFGARYYDSDLSSWLSVDPMASERSWVSPYSYCQNSPVMRVDPTGALDGDPDRWKHNRNTGEVTWEGIDGGATTQTITTVEYDGKETEYEITGKGFDINGELYVANENGRYQGGHDISC